MKRIFFTQRVEIIKSYGERRDCADQQISAFLRSCGFLPFPVPNDAEVVHLLWEDVKPDGIFLSGGNNLLRYAGDAPERDEAERTLVECAIKDRIPVFGICRGLQFLVDYFGGELEAVEHHVRTRHRTLGTLSRPSVNSYHTLGTKKLPPALVVLAMAEDGTVEALRHAKLPIYAVGWHPEREHPFAAEDIALVQKVYGREESL